jgi:hypothetical protein
MLNANIKLRRLTVNEQLVEGKSLVMLTWRSIKRPTVILSLLLITWANRSRAADPPTLGRLRLVALSNDSFDGVPAGVTVDQFSQPHVDAAGRVGIKARLVVGPGGVSSSNDSAIWSETQPGTLHYVAREGDLIPGLNYRFSDPDPGSTWNLSDAGTSFFVAGMTSTTNPATGNSAVFKFSPTTGFQVVAVSSPVGGGIPSTNSDFFSNFLDINESGNVTMQTGVGSGPVWSLDPIGLVQVAPTAVFPALNDFGDVAYRVNNIDNARRLEVWDRASGQRIVMSQNQVAPGAGGATFFRMGDQGTFGNANGKVSFIGGLQGAGVTQDNDFGIWSESGRGGPVTLDLREGQHAPGTPAGDVLAGFSQSSQPLTFSRSGTVALRLALAGPDVSSTNDSGVWAGMTPSQLHLAVREGDPAPGTEPGLVFSQFDQAGVTQDGRAVFQAFLSGSGLAPDRDRGLWAEGIDGLLHLVVRRGDSVQLPSGEVVQLTSVQFTPGFGVSGLGYVAFLSDLSNGKRAIFVSNVALVPEPAAALLAVAAVGTMSLIARPSRRRRG